MSDTDMPVDTLKKWSDAGAQAVLVGILAYGIMYFMPKTMDTFAAEQNRLREAFSAQHKELLNAFTLEQTRMRDSFNATSDRHLATFQQVMREEHQQLDDALDKLLQEQRRVTDALLRKVGILHAEDIRPGDK